MNLLIDVASWVLARIADVLLGKQDGEPYVSETTRRLEDLQEDVGARRVEKARLVQTSGEWTSCPFCGPGDVCLCKGWSR